MEKKNFWDEVSKIIFSLGDPKNESTVELHEKEKSSIEGLSKKLAEYAENNLINDQIGVISIPYTKNNDEKRKFVLILLFNDYDDNRCKILARFDIKHELHKIPMSTKRHRILVNSAVYASTGEERKHVVLSYYKGNNECVILTEFDYALTDWEKVLLVNWISKCAKEDPDKLFEFLEEY